MRAIGPATLLGIISVMRTMPADGADSKDASDMICVQVGVFIMGSNNGPEDERPQRQVNVGEFFIDRTKVSNLQFAQFMNPKGGHHNISFRCAR